MIRVPGQMRVIVPDQFSPVLDAGPWVDDVLPIYAEEAAWLANAMRAGGPPGTVEVGPDHACVTIYAETMTWECDGRDTGWLSSIDEMIVTASALALIPQVRRDLQDPKCDDQALATLVALRGQALEGIFAVEADVSGSLLDRLGEVHRYDLDAPMLAVDVDDDDGLWS